MEGKEEFDENKGNNEVVVSISAIEETSSRNSTVLGSGSPTIFRNSDIRNLSPGFNELKCVNSKLTSFYHPLEITKSSPSPNRSPQIPQETVRNRKILKRAVYSKPKSRLVEPSHPDSDSDLDEKNNQKLLPFNSPYRNATSNKSNASTLKEKVKSGLVTPKTPLMASPGGAEDDDEGVYKIATRKMDEKLGKKIRLTVLLEWFMFVLIMCVLITSLTIHKLQHCRIWSLELWKWSVFALVIFCGRLLTEWFINVLVFLIERNFLLKKKVMYFVYGLKKSVRIFIWLSLIFLAWALLINRGVKRLRRTRRILRYITWALVSFLIGAGLWMVKTFLIKLLASSFQTTRFFDRIQESLFHQYILQTLSGPSLIQSRSSGQLSFNKKKEGKKVEKEEVVNVEKLHKMKQEKVSSWTMRGLIKVIQQRKLSTISNALDDSDNDEEMEQKDKEITSEVEAKAAAFQVFKNVARPGYRFFEEVDLLRFLNKEEVDTIFPMFEGAAETRKITKIYLRKWVVDVYNERKLLAHSLNDTKTAIEELNKISSGFVIIVTIIVWLLLMGFATTTLLVFISSQLLLVVFIFGNTCKTAFEAIIFVFVMHPFDVGDRCVIDGVQMVVEEMNILTTIFLRYDNEKIFYPNSVLSTKPISNFYRSPEMSDSVEFAIDVKTSVESIVSLKAKIKEYIKSKPQHWRPNHSVQVKEIEDVNKMTMGLYVSHTINFQNYGEKSSRRSELVFELKKIFEELAIKYSLLPQEVHISNHGR